MFLKPSKFSFRICLSFSGKQEASFSKFSAAIFCFARLDVVLGHKFLIPPMILLRFFLVFNTSRHLFFTMTISKDLRSIWSMMNFCCRFSLDILSSFSKQSATTSSASSCDFRYRNAIKYNSGIHCWWSLAMTLLSPLQNNIRFR